ncbi:MAG: metallophosphoesterase [Eubacteriales bacterium]|nr:metallophosphoesterase [Eubacteriales bacterium]MDD3880828.1 metallophosphoesterase [Eubacteriales bacterium]MDD4511805.1 metallophosphoesterase [Eubacteriales bacterium]
MRVFAIGDLHLSGGMDKPMNVFGEQWDNHFARISQSWQNEVADDDLVLIPGDLSWAMQLENAKPDLEAIASLPGRKLILRGNHDYWWSSLTQLRAALPKSMSALQNDAFEYEACVVCGTRLWTCPTIQTVTADDEKIYLRELGRLKLSIGAAKKLSKDKPLVCMLHYPPITEGANGSEVADILAESGVSFCVYGHLHGAGIKAGFNGDFCGVEYRLVSCDALSFSPLRII